MSDELKPVTAADRLSLSQYVEAEVVPGNVVNDTAASVERVRTVTTSMTEGTIVLRYAPRAPRAAGRADTKR